MGKISKYIFFLIFLFGISLAQNSEQIDQENKKLSEIHAQIEQLEREIANLNKNEKSIDKELDKIEEQLFLLGKVVRKYENRIGIERKNIDSLNFMISENIANQKKLKSELQKYLVFRYKQREVTWLDFLFDSKTFSEIYENQFWDEYLSRKINQKIENLKNLEKELSANRENLLESENKLKFALVESKKSENLVVGKQQDKLSALLKIRKNKKGMSNLVNQKRKDEEKITKLIQKLIEDEIRKSNKTEITKSEEKKPIKKEVKIADEKREKFNFISGEKFANLKGNLPKPVSNARIIQKFGNVTNQTTKTVTVSSGVNFLVGKYPEIKVVSDGIVSVIQWLPGYGSVVIVNHGNNYKTVYGNVGNLRVLEGSQVKSGEILGEVSETIEGKVMHFQIWKGKKAENPEIWFKK